MQFTQIRRLLETIIIKLRLDLQVSGRSIWSEMDELYANQINNSYPGRLALSSATRGTHDQTSNTFTSQLAQSYQDQNTSMR